MKTRHVKPTRKRLQKRQTAIHKLLDLNASLLLSEREKREKQLVALVVVRRES